jgi:hypothetical protein
MDKLKGLLKQLGGSEELVGAITEEINKYAEGVKAKYDKQFHDRILKARQVCLEEVQKEKVALARKVSIFLESKLETMEKATEKHRLQEDTEALNKLKRMRALLEGVSFDDNGQSQDLQTTKKRLSRLTKAFGALKEERDVAVRKANSANDIALKTLQRNRLLESKVKATEVLSESAPAKPKSTPRSKAKANKVLEESSKRRRLGKNRSVPSQRKTTRATLKESQVKSNSGKASDRRISGIAASMGSDD